MKIRLPLSLVIVAICQRSVLGSPEPDATSNFPQYKPGGAACTREHIGDSLRGMAPCTPRDKVIPVPWPNNTDVHQLTPSHVVVKRCSGGCHNSGTCVARVTRVRNVSVMMGKCPVGGGKCDKECASLQVEDEVECECGCSKHVQATCQEKQKSHVFNKDTCECQCKDQDARKKCFETPGKVWDSSSCSCICGQDTTCHTGLEYNFDTCMCQPVAQVDQAETSAVVRDDRDSHITSASDIYKYVYQNWIEVVIIIALATISVILSIICAALLRKIHVLKTVIQNSKTSHVKVAPNLYSPCPVSPYESHAKPNQDSPIIRSTTQLDPKSACNKMLEMYSSDSEISSERQTDCSYYTDTSLTLTPPPPCQCFVPGQLDGVSECSTLLGRETNV